MTNRFDPFDKSFDSELSPLGDALRRTVELLRADKLTTGYHLVILKKPYLDAILAGQKRIESRFSKTKPYSFGRVLAGDKLFLKESSGPVCATAKVTAVRNFENLAPGRIIEIKKQYNRYILGSDEYWRSRRGCRFGFLVWLEDVKSIEPVRINKKDWRAWVVLTEKEEFGLLKTDAAKKPNR